MKNSIIILMAILMLAALVSCADDAVPYKFDSLSSEIETESTNTESSYAETSIETIDFTEQTCEEPVVSNDPPMRQDTSSPAQQNNTSKANNDGQSLSIPESSDPPNTSSSGNQAVNPFDPSPYEAEAIRYGKSLGLIYDEAYVSRGNWNPWINLTDKLSEVQMMQNIRDSLQILVSEDREYFFIYCEFQSDKSYHMFIFFG